MTLLDQSGWKKLLLVLAVFPCCRSLEVSIPQQQYEITAGGDITLTCSFVPARPNYDLLILKWEAIKDNIGDPVATFYSKLKHLNQIDISPDYEGRVTMEVNVAEQRSTLHLTKVTIQDSRKYECSALIPGDDEGTTSATTNLLVLVPPSKPICSIEGTVEYFHDIALTCMSEGSPKPVNTWKSYSVENVQRPFPPKTTEKNGALYLFNISREMSGFYICTSTNQVGSASCNMTLAVLPGGSISGATVGIIAGVVLGLVFLGILIFCCCRKKNKKDKYTESSPGDMEFYDKDGPEAGKEYWDDKSDTATETKRRDVQYEDQDIDPQNKYNVGAPVHKLQDDQHSYNSGKERHDGRYVDDGYQDNQRDHYRGSRDNLDDQRNRHGGSRDHLDDQRNRYGGSRDHLDNQRNRYGGSRDNLDDQRNRYGGSRDNLDDQRNRYGGSRDHLDRQHDSYRSSRDQLDRQHDSYRSSRDQLDRQHDSYRSSRDHLDRQHDSYRSSRDRLNEQHDRYGGSHDQLDDPRDRYRGSRDRLNYAEDEYRH